jgi:AcrR family transcriptional regulator
VKPLPVEPVSPREARRQQRIDLSREQILDTAEQLFGERGYHDTGLKEVAERCEFSVGSLYSFFDGKDALYQAVLSRRSRGQVAQMHRIAEGTAPADERLLEMARLQIDYFRKYPAWGRLTTRVLTPGLPMTAEIPTGFRDGYRAAIELEAGMIAAGQREGVLKAGDPRALARLFSALVSTFHLMDAEVSDEPADLGVDEFLTFVTDAFAVRIHD